jgi:hypothetical protein
MSKYTRFSARASLAAVGLRMRQMKIWEEREKRVQINQKVIRHTPQEKLMDAFINVLAGGHGIVEVNTRVRPDAHLQRAFGRTACADQSTISDTLNACTEENVDHMRQALQEIYRTHSRGYQHRYKKSWQVLDIDLTGMPAGRQGEGVTKGFFSGQRGRRGRQLGRVVASLYDEIVVERLYPGTVQLERSLQALVSAAEEVLHLKQAQRLHTITRVDGGGGRDADINWLLERGYHVMVKVKNWQRTVKLAESVEFWHPDPKVPGREAGWVTEPHSYVRPTRQLVVRKRKKDGKWQYRALVFTLTDRMLLWLARKPPKKRPTALEILFAAVHAYDLRGGAAETTFKASKQGLAVTKRNKRSFTAQEMLVLMAQLAYNLISWIHIFLAACAQKLLPLGIMRIVRDLFHITGEVEIDHQGHISRITLNQAHSLSPPFVRALSPLLARDGTLLNLGQI